MRPFLAMIIPVGGDGTVPEPPGIWGPTDPRPTPPIMWPGYPGGGGGGQPPPGIWGPNDPRPSNPIPIYPGGSPNPPSGGGGGGAPVYPSHPIYWPPYPSAPIYPTPPWQGPPVAGWPDVPGNWPSLPGKPITPPVLPPEIPELPEGSKLLLWKDEDGNWQHAVIPKPPPGYTPPTGSGSPPNVATPVNTPAEPMTTSRRRP